MSPRDKPLKREVYLIPRGGGTSSRENVPGNKILRQKGKPAATDFFGASEDSEIKWKKKSGKRPSNRAKVRFGGVRRGNLDKPKKRGQNPRKKRGNDLSDHVGEI